MSKIFTKLSDIDGSFMIYQTADEQPNGRQVSGLRLSKEQARGLFDDMSAVFATEPAPGKGSKGSKGSKGKT